MNFIFSHSQVVGPPGPPGNCQIAPTDWSIERFHHVRGYVPSARRTKLMLISCLNIGQTGHIGPPGDRGLDGRKGDRVRTASIWQCNFRFDFISDILFISPTGIILAHASIGHRPIGRHSFWIIKRVQSIENARNRIVIWSHSQITVSFMQFLSFVSHRISIHSVHFAQGEKGHKGDSGPMGLPVSISFYFCQLLLRDKALRYQHAHGQMVVGRLALECIA